MRKHGFSTPNHSIAGHCKFIAAISNVASGDKRKEKKHKTNELMK